LTLRAVGKHLKIWSEFKRATTAATGRFHMKAPRKDKGITIAQVEIIFNQRT